MDRICHWTKAENGTAFTLNGLPAGVAEAMPGARDAFSLVEDGVVCWTRTLAAPAERMTLRFRAVRLQRLPVHSGLQRGAQQLPAGERAAAV